MIDTHETSADIIAEMRFHGQLNIDAEKDKPEYGILTVEGRIILSYADRFDAANKREYAMQKSVIDNLTKALKGTVEGLAWIYDREGYGYGTDAAYAAGCAVLDLLGVEYKKEGDAK